MTNNNATSENEPTRSWLENPKYMLLIAALALGAGIYMASNTTRAAEERALLPARPDCRRFPGACEENIPSDPPPELRALHADVERVEAQWRITLEQNRRTGVFPDKALTDMRDALVATQSAIADARFLLAEAEGKVESSVELNAADSAQASATATAQINTTGNADTRVIALQVLREAYEQKLALLTRAVRLFEGAV